jgi:hypothetical protein
MKDPLPPVCTGEIPGEWAVGGTTCALNDPSVGQAIIPLSTDHFTPHLRPDCESAPLHARCERNYYYLRSPLHDATGHPIQK